MTFRGRVKNGIIVLDPPAALPEGSLVEMATIPEESVDAEALRPTLADRYAAVIGIDLRRARRVASQLRAGRVVINGMTDDPQAPWGGFKYSGVGREYGRYGIEAFVESRAILG